MLLREFGKRKVDQVLALGVLGLAHRVLEQALRKGADEGPRVVRHHVRVEVTDQTRLEVSQVEPAVVVGRELIH